MHSAVSTERIVGSMQKNSIDKQSPSASLTEALNVTGRSVKPEAFKQCWILALNDCYMRRTALLSRSLAKKRSNLMLAVNVYIPNLTVGLSYAVSIAAVRFIKVCIAYNYTQQS